MLNRCQTFEFLMIIPKASKSLLLEVKWSGWIPNDVKIWIHLLFNTSVLAINVELIQMLPALLLSELQWTSLIIKKLNIKTKRGRVENICKKWAYAPFLITNANSYRHNNVQRVAKQHNQDWQICMLFVILHIINFYELIIEFHFKN